jgi:hypothetical protein
MKSKIFVLVLIFISISKSKAQTPNLLTSKRVFLDSKILNNGEPLRNYEVKQLFKKSNDFKALRKFNLAKPFLYTGVPTVLGGIYLAYDAIKGTKMSVVENGQTLVYYKRPIFQLMGGVGLFTVGICLIEYSNEFKMDAVNIYNAKNANQNKGKISHIKAGILPSSNVGISVGF